MKEYLSRTQIQKPLQQKHNIFLFKNVMTRVNSTARIYHTSSFGSYNRQRSWYIPYAREKKIKLDMQHRTHDYYV